MEKVLEQARLLAEAIAESDVYQKMHQCEKVSDEEYSG